MHAIGPRPLALETARINGGHGAGTPKCNAAPFLLPYTPMVSRQERKRCGVDSRYLVHRAALGMLAGPRFEIILPTPDGDDDLCPVGAPLVAKMPLAVYMSVLVGSGAGLERLPPTEAIGLVLTFNPQEPWPLLHADPSFIGFYPRLPLHSHTSLRRTAWRRLLGKYRPLKTLFDVKPRTRLH